MRFFIFCVLLLFIFGFGDKNKPERVFSKLPAVYSCTVYMGGKIQSYSEYNIKNQELLFENHDNYYKEITRYYKYYDTLGNILRGVLYEDGKMIDSADYEYVFDEKGRKILETVIDSEGVTKTYIDFVQRGDTTIEIVYIPGKEKSAVFYKNYYDSRNRMVKTMHDDGTISLRFYNNDDTEKMYVYRVGKRSDTTFSYYDEHKNCIRKIEKGSYVISETLNTYDSLGHKVELVYTKRSRFSGKEETSGLKQTFAWKIIHKD